MALPMSQKRLNFLFISTLQEIAAEPETIVYYFSFNDQGNDLNWDEAIEKKENVVCPD